MKFLIFVDDTLIGETQFEHGDPPMGIIHGSVHPNDEYDNFRSYFLSSNEGKQKPQVTIKMENGEILPTGGGGISDYSDHTEDLPNIFIEMSMDSAESYDKYFKHHVLAYEESFK